MNLRPVYYDFYSERAGKTLKGHGYFHQWAIVLENYNDSFYQNTYAIVEDAFGQIHSVFPPCIKFTDK